jgi:C_GCAxxG_C_C family probable redox protein
VYGPCFGLEKELALRLATAFGGGMGRNGELCGALSGSLMVIGMRHGRVDLADASPRDTAYQLTSTLFERFKAEHGSVHCFELLGANLSDPKEYQRARENNLFRTRCPEFIRAAAENLEVLLDIPQAAAPHS